MTTATPNTWLLMFRIGQSDEHGSMLQRICKGTMIHAKCIETPRCFAVFAAFALFHSFVSGSELKSEELNYVVNLPDGWTILAQNMGGFAIASPDNKQTVTLIVRETHASQLDAETIAGLEQGMLKAGPQKLSSRQFTIDGVPAYETIHFVGKPPAAISYIAHFFIADEKHYTLGGMYDGVQTEDLRLALSSFRFLHRPSPPSRSGTRGRGVLWGVGIILCAGALFWVLRRRSAR